MVSSHFASVEHYPDCSFRSQVLSGAIRGARRCGPADMCKETVLSPLGSQADLWHDRQRRSPEEASIHDDDHRVQFEPANILLLNTLAPNLTSLSMITSHNATVRVDTINSLGEVKNLQYLRLQIQLPPGQRASSPLSELRDAVQYRMQRGGEVAEFGSIEDMRVTSDLARTMERHLNVSVALDLFRDLRRHKQGSSCVICALRR